MKTAYFNCFAGISGDMIVGALLDCGLSFHDLKQEIEKLPVSDYSLSCEKVVKNSIGGIKFNVTVLEKQPERHLHEIERIIRESALDSQVIDTSIKIFRKIGEAESKIHGVGIEELHFHEIGALDSIIDIVASVIALQKLGIKKIISSPINLGSGFVNSMHGKLPVPAPATVELLKGIPVYSSGALFELTTPTGAAIISTMADKFGEIPNMKISSSGYGAGMRDLEIPNLLRVIIGETDDSEADTDSVMVIETNIDDMNPEFYQHVYDKLLQAGALDVYSTPIVMKKTRPGILLGVISGHADADNLIDIIFSETTSSGVRITEVKRKKLARSFATVSTRFGDIKIKVHKKDGNIITLSPEYEECERIALKTGRPLKEVYDEAKAEAIRLELK